MITTILRFGSILNFIASVQMKSFIIYVRPNPIPYLKP